STAGYCAAAIPTTYRPASAITVAAISVTTPALTAPAISATTTPCPATSAAAATPTPSPPAPAIPVAASAVTAVSVTTPASPAPAVPRTGSDEDAAREPVRAVKSIRSACVWIVRVVAVIDNRLVCPSSQSCPALKSTTSSGSRQAGLL